MNSSTSPASGYLVRSADQTQKRALVLDFGPGVLGMLQRFCDPVLVDVAMTHLHPDHRADFPSLLVWRRYHPVPAQGKAQLYGPTDTATLIGRAAADSALDFDDISDTIDFTSWSSTPQADINGLHVATRPVVHPGEAYGFRITDTATGSVLVYSGDSADCAELRELAVDADTFLCEASWEHDERRPKGLHLSGTECGRIATDSKVKRLIVTHIPPWTNAQAIYNEVVAEYSGPLIMASAGAQITI